MLKKKIVVAACLVTALMMTGCGSDAESDSKFQQNNQVNEVLQSQMAAEDAKKDTTEATTETTTEATTQATTEATTEAVATKSEADSSESASSGEELTGEPDPNVDVDLTVMNSDMVYATVYQMMVDPDSYVGKKIKMDGNYYTAEDPETGVRYFFVIIQDATACCSQGLEFVWDDGSHVYPDEYPADNAEVEVEGTFELYKDNPDDQMQYVRIADAALTFSDSNNQ